MPVVALVGRFGCSFDAYHGKEPPVSGSFRLEMAVACWPAALEGGATAVRHPARSLSADGVLRRDLSPDAGE